MGIIALTMPETFAQKGGWGLIHVEHVIAQSAGRVLRMTIRGSEKAVWTTTRKALKPWFTETPVNIGAREEQIYWHWKNARAGGRSWFWAKIGQDWVLIPGRYAPIVNKHSTAELVRLVESVEDGALWRGGFKAEDLKGVLSR